MRWNKGFVFKREQKEYVIVATWHKAGVVTHYDIREALKEDGVIYKMEASKIECMTINDFQRFDKKLYV